MRKKLLGIALCLAVIGSMVGCGDNKSSESASAGSGSIEKSGSEGDAGENQKDMKIAVVLHAMNSSFYTKMSDGAKAAGKDLGITVDVMAPTTASNLSEQVSLMESCITAGYQGIATVTWDPSGFNSVIAKANDAGIPVVGFNQDAEGCGSEAFVGQEHEDAGYQMGKYMFGEVMNGQGKYVVASCAPTDSALIARTTGIEKAAKEYPDIEFGGVIDIGTDLTNAYSVIENAYLADSEIDAILGVDVFSEAIGTYISTNGLNEKIKAAGFDLVEGTLEHVKKGDMQLTVGQNPYLQGYYSVLDLYMNLAHDGQFIDVNTGAQLVTADNVNEVEPE